MEPDRYGQNNLTVKHLLFSNNVNVSSAMSVVTIDNALRVDKESSVKNKRKGINTENTENNSVTLTKKTKAIDEENQPDLTDLTNVEVCSCQNCLYPNLTLENFGTSNCIKKLHHICQTNIDEAQYHGNFERPFGLRFTCSDCIVELQKIGLFPSSEDDCECVSDEEKGDVINNDSTDIHFIERGDEIEESDKSDESSINVSSDDTDNDNEVMKTGLSIIYETYFWKSFKNQ